MLDEFSAEGLKSVLKTIDDKTKGRKEILKKQIIKLLSRKSFIKEMWKMLSETEKYAVSEAFRNKNASIDIDKFNAKYRTDLFIPEHGSTYYYFDSDDIKNPDTKIHAFFLNNHTIPEEIIMSLTDLVYSTKSIEIECSSEMPVTEDKEIRVFNGEESVKHDLYIVLDLVSKEKIKVSEKTRKPSEASQKLIADMLIDKDFFNPSEFPKKSKYHEVPGYIRAYAWSLLLQEGKMAAYSKGKLSLTKVGTKNLSRPMAEIVKEMLTHWMAQKEIDEFNRIDLIKGQNPRSRNKSLTNVLDRKKAILSALKSCPANKWIAIDEFSRFMMAKGLDFQVAEDPWALYIVDREYGSLGYEGSDSWEIFQERYIMALFMEYFTTLGIIDIIFKHPDNARNDCSDLWGMDEYAFLSRYDGLLYFRINELGSYCLEKKKEYVNNKKNSVVEKKIELLKNFEIYIKKELSSSEKFFLEKISVKKQDFIWQLSEAVILDSVEKGITYDDIKQFLVSLSGNSIPKNIDLFLEKIKNNIEQFTGSFHADVFSFRDSNIALEISEKRTMKKFCYLCGSNAVAVKKDKLNTFYSELKKMGYVIPIKKLSSE